jgi:hypothetical protein
VLAPLFSNREVTGSIPAADSDMTHSFRPVSKIMTLAKNAIVHSYVPAEAYAIVGQTAIVNKLGEIERDVNGVELLKLMIKKKNDGSIILSLNHNKCRTNLLRFLANGTKYNVFSALSDIVMFDVENDLHRHIPCGEYYLVMPNKEICPTKGNGWYTHIMVKYLMSCKLITFENITHICKADLFLPGNYYSEMVETLPKKLIIADPVTDAATHKREVQIAKQCVNQFVGTLGIRTFDHNTLDIFTSI